MTPSNDRPSHPRQNVLERFWIRVPLVVRAIIVGLLVLVTGNFIPQGFIAANLKSPAVPWSSALVAAWLGLYWLYLRGSGWPRETVGARRLGLRAAPLPSRVWGWSLTAGAFGIGGLLCATYAASYLMPLGLGGFPEALQRLPPSTAFAIVVTVATMAGVVEEAAFRGYMQGPIERRHGPAAAIAVVSVVFVLAHFPGPGDGPRIVLILVASVGYGILAYLSGSILPGVILHAAQDIAGSALLWRAARNAPNPSDHGWGSPMFLMYFAAAAVLFTAAIWSFRRLGSMDRA